VTRPLVLIAAGGTGGHMFPARAFAEALAARAVDAALITDPRGARYAEGFPARETVFLPVANADAGGLGAKLRAAVGHVRSLGVAREAVVRLEPSLIAGFGGYPSFPALAVADGVPILIHEQNAVLGRVNRWFQGKAARVASGFSRLDRLTLQAAARHVVTGNPVRAPFVAAASAPYAPPAPEGEIRLLVTGGSQGARILGDVVPAALALLPTPLRARVRLEAQIRAEQADAASAALAKAGVAAEVAPFLSDMADRITRAHLVIGRAGASTVSEIACIGRPSVLVPLAIATNDHQSANAVALAAAGAADVLPEAGFSAAALAALLGERLQDPAGLAERAAAAAALGRPDAADRLAALACEIIAARG
jgi:UDP-N-acetylglucosamine--N-acetylmuramyl-(pentapeptide) pyrophosphoryl-undecaprenol N-acetylglucosamine transferase